MLKPVDKINIGAIMPAMKTIYDIIKKQNGLAFAQEIRRFDNGIFDISDIANILRYAGRDAKPLLTYLEDMKNKQVGHDEDDGDVGEVVDPFKLLARAGYDAYHADTHEKHVSISKYYAPGENICFFYNHDRPDNYYIVNAVHKNAGDLRRRDFTSPERGDEYGGSVFSIHMLKSGGFICITNRYNHTVSNPDNSFDSNPDNIVPGLSGSLKKYFDVDFVTGGVSLPEGFISAKGRICKYSRERGGIYFGDGFWAKDGVVTELDPAYEIFLDHFKFDSRDKSLTELTPKRMSKPEDGFLAAFRLEMKGKTKDEKEPAHITKTSTGSRVIKIGERVVVETRESKIISASLTKTKKIGDDFLSSNDSMVELSLPNVDAKGLPFVPGIFASNGFMVGNLYYDYAMKLREERRMRG